MGPSGSGKTTLVNLMARFWDVDAGAVLLGGQDVRKGTAESLLAHVSMVFQNVYLFNDTVENNIKFGMPNATHADVEAAARRARCHEFIMDEATSSVDPENEHELIAAIGELTRGKTLVSIAHRLNTVAGADQILVVDEGRIVQRGTHDQLMGEQGLYRDFVNLRREAAGWRLAG